MATDVTSPGAPWWAGTVEDALKAFDTSVSGLSSAEAAARLARHGPNSLPASRRRPLAVLLGQFVSPLVLILIAAAAVSWPLGERVDAGVILGIVLLNAVLGFTQEFRAERSLQALNAYITRSARVWRDGQLVIRPVEDLVPGDVVRIELGDLVPADLRVLEAEDLATDQSSLTGESWPAAKGTTPAPGGAGPADITSGAFLGSIVASGTGTGLVVATARATWLGRTAVLLAARPRETDFQRNIRRLSTTLVQVIAILTLFIFATNVLLHRGWFESFLFAVALAVGITPEVLPAIVTITLARGALRMAKDEVVTRRLMSVEDLGNVDVLCCDKTGTLTEGAFEFQGAVDPAGTPSDEVLAAGLLAASSRAAPLDQALQRSPERERLKARLGTARVVDENPFDHERRRESVVIEEGGGHRLVVKGAPESVLGVCAGIDDGERARLTGLVDGHERLGVRVIAVADREITAARTSRMDEHDLTLRGFLLFVDPAKPSAAASVRRLTSLGIRLVVLSGDGRTVTERVCREVGVPVAEDRVISGEELAGLDAVAFAARAARYTVFARVSPEQKRQVVAALSAAGHVVGALGDGVNDAPALRAADVGVAVDNGTDVCKEAADIVLLRKDLSVLALGIVEGRKTFANITKYIYNTVSANFGNMITVALSSLFLPFLPMLPPQILLTNFLTDLPMVAVATDRVDEDLVQRPRSWSIRAIVRFMLWFGALSALFDLLLIGLLRWRGVSVEAFRTAWFVESTISEIIVTFAIRTRHAFFRSRPGTALLLASAGSIVLAMAIPLTVSGERLFGFVAPGMWVGGMAAGVLVSYFLAAEAAKRPFFRGT